MRIIVSITFFLSLSIISAQEITQRSASVDFKIRNMGFNVDGTFNDVVVNANFDSNDLTNSYIKGIIKVNSIDTGNQKRDKHLRTADYFEVETYNTIRLSSTQIVKKSANSYLLTAQLTIKDKTKTINVPIEVTENKTSITLKSSFEIDRLDYGVGESSWVMSDRVKIEVNFSGNK